jgi:hypothetical protein
MTLKVSRRSLFELGAGLGASTMLGGSALAKAPKLGTEPGYFYRFDLGNAEVTVVSDGPLPLGPPKGTFVGVPDDEVKKMLADNFLPTDNVVLEQNSPIVNTGDSVSLFPCCRPLTHIAEQESRHLSHLDLLAALGDAVAAMVPIDMFERLVA